MKAESHYRTPLLFSFYCAIIALLLSVAVAAPGSTARAEGDQPPTPYLTVDTKTLADGTSLTKTTIGGPPKPPPGFEVDRGAAEAITASAKVMTVPAYSWVFGCSAVSGAMIAGYYDNNGYPNMYAGPTDGGVAPLVEPLAWGRWSDGIQSYPNNPLIASHNGVDGRATKGSVDDYWVQYMSTAQDPYIGKWIQHVWGSAIGDYMKTSQSAYGNRDGETAFYNWTSSSTKLQCSDMPGLGVSQVDGTYGRKLFYQARGYTVTDCFNQPTDNKAAGGFSFANYKVQIDTGRPVLLNLAGHSIVGVGYDAATNQVYIHDTWDSNNHTMTWGGSYSGMQLLSVSVVNLAPSGPMAQAPSGAISDSAPTYTWSVMPDATQYQYEVKQGTTTIYSAVVDAKACKAAACSDTPATVLPDGSYQWHVRAYVVGGWTTYSANRAFRVVTVPVPQSPAGVIMDTTPTYKWIPVPGATGYEYQLSKGTVTLYSQAVDAGACTATTCTHTPTTVLLPGVYEWKIMATAGGPSTDFSTTLSFTISNIPTAKTPAGITSDTTPTYTWSKISGATQYRYQLWRGTTLIYTKLVGAAACTTTTCSNTPTNVLPYAAYKWAVQAQYGGMWTSYSPYRTFTITSVPTIKAPTGVITDTTPTFTWTKISGATQYSYSLYKSGMLKYTKTVASTACGSSPLTCSNTPTAVLLPGSYAWKVRSYVGGKWSAYSVLTAFTIPVP